MHVPKQKAESAGIGAWISVTLAFGFVLVALYGSLVADLLHRT